MGKMAAIESKRDQTGDASAPLFALARLIARQVAAELVAAVPAPSSSTAERNDVSTTPDAPTAFLSRVWCCFSSSLRINKSMPPSPTSTGATMATPRERRSRSLLARVVDGAFVII